MKPPPVEVAAHLPLTPIAFEVLLALADGDRHGYDVMLEIERRTDGRLALHAGTLYRAIHRLVEAKLIALAGASAAREAHGERRTYFRLTKLGARVASAEADRLAGQVSAARARRLLKDAGASS